MIPCTTTAYIQGQARQAIARHSDRRIQGQARQAMARHGARRCLVIVDYLQRMAHASGYGTLRENVSALTLGLRELATRLDSPSWRSPAYPGVSITTPTPPWRP